MCEDNGVLAGKVISYVESCSSVSSKVKALIQAGTSIVSIDLEFLQYEFVMQEYPVGSSVDVAYYGGCWHFQGLSEKHGISKAIQSVGRQASYFKKGIASPAGEELCEPADMAGDIDYVMSHIGTFDLSKPSDRPFKGMRWPSRKSVKCN